jgi:hypothetical protein
MQTEFIQDLDFLEAQNEPQSIIGGVYTQVSGTAQTGYGFASANINSLANGQRTSTFGSTFASVQRTSFSTSSNAQATGVATATSGNSFSSTTNKYVSSSTYINCSFP